MTEARAATNCIAPALSLDDFAGLQALASLRSGVSLEPRPVPSGAAEPCCFYAAFGTLFQGDHGGVEYATSGHQGLLREQGLLRDCDRLLGQHAVPNTSCYEALVIDDISRELAAALAGSWTSVLLFRLGLGHLSGQAGSDVVALSRAQAQEIALLAALSPVVATNVALPFARQAYCTDASLHKGAVVAAKVGASVCEALWSSAPRKGHYTMLSHGGSDQDLRPPS